MDAYKVLGVEYPADSSKIDVCTSNPGIEILQGAPAVLIRRTLVFGASHGNFLFLSLVDQRRLSGWQVAHSNASALTILCSAGRIRNSKSHC